MTVQRFMDDDEGLVQVEIGVSAAELLFSRRLPSGRTLKINLKAFNLHETAYLL